ncbi:MAG TPA: HNH endonuclease signature motif containing protein [Bacteriovoracaceae bacterium]|nr:HNH endonuclease signature motif containing protein [Bacteriovoracaceae bacterium]
MNLKHLTDSTLHIDTLKLVTREREATSQILHHLQENDRRKLYSEYKCASLFAYCVKILGYSESSAQRRIVAARLLRYIPEIEEKIEQGSLSLSNIGQANTFFKDYKIEKIEEQKKILNQIEDMSKKDCEKMLLGISGEKKPARESNKRISKDKVKVSIILSDETQAEVEKLKALLGKDISMNELIMFMAKTAIAKVEKDKFKQTDRPRSLPMAEVKRVPSAEVKREVYRRDKCCTKCGSQFRLNFDHREAYALGGKADISNMQLLCFNCSTPQQAFNIWGASPLNPIVHSGF